MSKHRAALVLRKIVFAASFVAIAAPIARLHAQSKWAFAGLSIPSSITTLTTDKGSVSWLRRGTFVGYPGGALASNQRLNGANYAGAGDYFVDGATRFAAARDHFIFDVSAPSGSSWATLSVTQGGVQGTDVRSFGFAISDVMWGVLGAGSVVGSLAFDAPAGDFSPNRKSR